MGESNAIPEVLATALDKRPLVASTERDDQVVICCLDTAALRQGGPYGRSIAVLDLVMTGLAHGFVVCHIADDFEAPITLWYRPTG